MPSQRVNTSGYLFVSRVKRIVAPALMWRLTLLFSRIAPVMNSPAGTRTLPPFAAWQAAIAFWNASVQSLLLSPTAPNRVTSKLRSGNVGGLIRARMAGSSNQGSVAAGAYAGKFAGDGRTVRADKRLGRTSTPLDAAIPTAPRPLINSRRFMPLLFVSAIRL